MHSVLTCKINTRKDIQAHVITVETNSSIKQNYYARNVLFKCLASMTRNGVSMSNLCRVCLNLPIHAKGTQDHQPIYKYIRPLCLRMDDLWVWIYLTVDIFLTVIYRDVCGD